jgi:threonine dehydratase
MEGACATCVAAALQHGDDLAGKTVAFPVTGRNIAVDKLRTILAER